MSENLDTLWNFFKMTILDTAKHICGSSKKTNKKKQTAWWSDEIKNQIKEKKKTWKAYLGRKTTENYEKYRNERKRVKELVSSTKKKQWMEFGTKMEKDSRGNQKLFYRTLKTIRMGKTQYTNGIKIAKGDMLTEDKDIMDRWKEYFQDLLWSKQNDQVVGQNVNSDILEGDNEELQTDIDEIDEVLKKLKNGKSPGYDRLTTEMLKHMGQKAKEILLQILNKALTEEQIPKDWKTSLIVPIFKKGDKYQCNNYRGITLTSVAIKVFEQIIDMKIRAKIDNTLAECQSGFRKGRSIQDHIFTVKQIIEKKCVQQGKKVFAGFIDLEKAFDKIPRSKLWTVLTK